MKVRIKQLMIIKGRVEKIIYQNEENHYCVFRFQAEEELETITVNGKFFNIHAGQNMEIEGNFIFNKYGEQFKAENYKELKPDKLEDIEQYLASGIIKGVGPVFAKKIVEKFHEQTFEIIENDPDRLLAVPGIGYKKAELIIESFKKQKAAQEIMMFLTSFNISMAYAMKIYKTYGSKSKEILMNNPYQLAEDIVGIGFFIADKIAMELGFLEDSNKRGQACVLFTLREKSKNGHVFLKIKELYQVVKQYIPFNDDQIDDALETLVKDNKVVITTIEQEIAIYLKYLFDCEQGVVEEIIRIIDHAKKNSQIHTRSDKKIKEDRIKYNDKQQEAIEYSNSKKLFIMTGGPGTGKTTTTTGIINNLISKGHQVVLAAPTGRAAKRLSQVVGYEAKTIHRLLEYNKDGLFLKNRENQLEGTAFIIDEASMIDLPLFYSLLKGIPDKAILILVGDVDQLPAIGPGNILKDLLNSQQIPSVFLEEIYRQGLNSKIVTNAHLINKKKMPKVENNKYDDFFQIKEAKDEKILDILIDLCNNRLPKSYGIDPVDDIQLLVPMKKGTLGSKNINKVMQNVFNPLGKSIDYGDSTFRIKDKVIQIKNNYEKNVFNGDIGFITDIHSDEILVDYDGMSVSYDYGELEELQLAYCLTIHKSQGSEYKVVIMPLATQHYVMLDKNLLYTGVTRAKDLFILIATDKVLRMAVSKENANSRNSGLAFLVKIALES